MFAFVEAFALKNLSSMPSKAIRHRSQAALLEAEQGNEPVDGGLLGMAAAQAGRLGLKDLLSTLCVGAQVFRWPFERTFFLKRTFQVA